jgi:hypothetical protein
MSQMKDEDFAQAVETILRSRVWAIADGAARMWRVSASDSRFVAAAARAWHAFEALPRQERFRAMAIAAAVAAAVHALLLGLVPPALRPAVPRAFWMVLSVAAAVAAVRKSGRKNQASDA